MLHLHPNDSSRQVEEGVERLDSLSVSLLPTAVIMKLSPKLFLAAILLQYTPTGAFLLPSQINHQRCASHAPRLLQLQDASSSPSQQDVKLLGKLASTVSQGAANRLVAPYFSSLKNEKERKIFQLTTLARVAIPSVVAGVTCYLAFPALAMGLASMMSGEGVFKVLSTDSSQFVQNFLSVSSLLFSILVGQTYYFLYTQQESVYYALFNEVTEAKSLLEQIALVCQGRSMYGRCLDAIHRYVKDDLKKLQADPAVLLSSRPVDDPLESIMYMTSVGVPSTVYETVRSLREARAQRLGALQRKLPRIHMNLLWILAVIELVSFPLLGAGTQIIGGYKLLTVEGILFGVMTAGIVLTLRVVGELWRPAGGAYNVDFVLSVMVRGLESELAARMAGTQVYKNLAEPQDGQTMDEHPSPPGILRAVK